MASPTASSNPTKTTPPDPPPNTTTTTATDQQPSLTDDADELDPEIDMAIDPAPAEDPENPALDEALPETREATRKDIALRDFLAKMDDYAPIVRPLSLFPLSLSLSLKPPILPRAPAI